MSLKLDLALEWYHELPLANRGGLTTKQFYTRVWQNTRDNAGFRLTPYGATIQSKLRRPVWSVPIKNTNTDVVRVLVQMDKYLDALYYINNRKHTIMVYDEQLATQILLYDGDLAAFLDAYQNIN